MQQAVNVGSKRKCLSESRVSLQLCAKNALLEERWCFAERSTKLDESNRREWLLHVITC